MATTKLGKSKDQVIFNLHMCHMGPAGLQLLVDGRQISEATCCGGQDSWMGSAAAQGSGSWLPFYCRQLQQALSGYDSMVDKSPQWRITGILEKVGSRIGRVTCAAGVSPSWGLERGSGEGEGPGCQPCGEAGCHGAEEGCSGEGAGLGSAGEEGCGGEEEGCGVVGCGRGAHSPHEDSCSCPCPWVQDCGSSACSSHRHHPRPQSGPRGPHTPRSERAHSSPTGGGSPSP